MTHTLTWKWTLHLLPHRPEQTTLVTVVAEVECSSRFSKKKKEERKEKNRVFQLLNIRRITVDLVLGSF